ncbi:hypothetical protein IQ249_01490 [Lusitaniella coriacea LEGE 07157]|uniref:Uncharacterized protein n=1 Tax=Lusitaniella coriacea LEGE 07157 TaxID=945747 RepID=A0A8J7AMH2_9CYAN|nr:hypothetical protein [Lusitaniella coriacea]MBE9114558.1 hypothetical protein [Lusitaniella coriacea LEGE 07157]
MSALQKPREPLENRRVLSMRSQPRQPYGYGSLLIETSLKLLVNGSLSVIAVVALVDLVPHLLSHQAKLKDIRSQVKEAEVQVNELREKFSYSFAPDRAKNVMQEQSARVDPNQRRVIWVKRTSN